MMDDFKIVRGKKGRKKLREIKESQKMIASMMGPSHVDQTIRMAVNHCWMILPEKKRNVAELEKQCRRILDRALAEFEADRKAFQTQES
jgi:hypothetical protein